MKQTRVMDETTITQDHHLIFVAFIISIIGTPINATTTGLIPLNARTTYSLSLNDVKNIAIRSIIVKGGRQLATVATTLPFVPRSLWPVRIEMFTAKRPGAVWARVMMSRKSSSFSQPLSISSLFIAAIIGIPPPMVNAPIFANTQNIFQSETMFLPLKSGFFPLFDDFRHKSKKNIKKSVKIFGGLKILRTFAARLRNNGNKSSLKRLKESTRSKYREYNKIYREALISLLGITECQDKLRNIIIIQ